MYYQERVTVNVIYVDEANVGYRGGTGKQASGLSSRKPESLLEYPEEVQRVHCDSVNEARRESGIHADKLVHIVKIEVFDGCEEDRNDIKAALEKRYPVEIVANPWS